MLAAKSAGKLSVYCTIYVRLRFAPPVDAQRNILGVTTHTHFHLFKFLKYLKHFIIKT